MNQQNVKEKTAPQKMLEFFKDVSLDKFYISFHFVKDGQVIHKHLAHAFPHSDMPKALRSTREFVIKELEGSSSRA